MSGLLSAQGRERLLSAELKDGKLQFRKEGTVTMVNDHLAACFPVSSLLKPLQSKHSLTHTHNPLAKNCQAVISASGLATRFGLLAPEFCKGNVENGYANQS